MRATRINIRAPHWFCCVCLDLLSVRPLTLHPACSGHASLHTYPPTSTRPSIVHTRRSIYLLLRTFHTHRLCWLTSLREHACDDKPDSMLDLSSYAYVRRSVLKAIGVKSTKQQRPRAICIYGEGAGGGRWVRMKRRRSLNELEWG